MTDPNSLDSNASLDDKDSIKKSIEESLLTTAAPITPTPSARSTSPAAKIPHPGTAQYAPQNGNNPMFAEQHPQATPTTQAASGQPTSPEDASQSPPKKKYNLRQYFHNVSGAFAATLGLVFGKLLERIRRRSTENGKSTENTYSAAEIKSHRNAATYGNKQAHSMQPQSQPPNIKIKEMPSPNGTEQNLQGKSAFNILNSDSSLNGARPPSFNANAAVADPPMPIPEKQLSPYNRRLEEELQGRDSNDSPGDEDDQPLSRTRNKASRTPMPMANQDMQGAPQHEQTGKTIAQTTPVPAATTQQTPVHLRRAASVPRVPNSPARSLRRTLSSH